MKLKAMCRKHDKVLEGDLYMVKEGENWIPDTSDMYCKGEQFSECNGSWDVIRVL
jgi:hypothetical protein